MAIVPDDKDWTWVLERPCHECGFAAGPLDSDAVIAGIRANAARWRTLVDHPAVAERPSPEQWSALEYTCHVRDVFRLGVRRIGWMLDDDEPTFANWDQDATATEDRYAEQDVAVVVDELEAAGAALADLLVSVPAEGWDRGGTRDSDRHRFTVATFARYVLHDPVHHVWDVEQGYLALAPIPTP